MSIARRGFLALAGVSVFGAAAVSVPLIWRSETDLIVGMLRKELPDLRMDPDDLTAFAEEFLLDYKSKGERRRGMILTGARIIKTLPDAVSDNVLPGPIKSPLARLERELFNAFFLGTDYFDVYSDPEQMVSFINIPDPYDVGCSNRLAQFDA